MTVIQAQHVSKVYAKSGTSVPALQEVDLTVDRGDFLIIHGSSGSGKTTLLLTLGGMLRPTVGNILFQGTDIYSLRTGKRAQYRRRHLGFMFQKFFLVPYLTARDNIRFPLALRGTPADSEERVREVAERLRIAHRLEHLPAHLSVGEQQRVAMARAIVAEPEIILADEPTGNLDRENRRILAQFLQDENGQGRTIVVVTHDDDLIRLGNRTIELVAGRLNAPHSEPSPSTSAACSRT